MSKKVNEGAMENRSIAGVSVSGSNGVVETSKKSSLSSANFDVDFMGEGSWLGINPKGQLYLREDDSITFDTIDAVIENCKQEYVLWGKEGVVGEDELLLRASSQAEAEHKLNELLSDKPEYAAHYESKDIKGRLIIVFRNTENDMMLAFNASASSKYAFGTYFKKLKNGLLGAPRGTEPDQVITKIGVESRKKGKLSWNVLTFNYVSMADDAIPLGEYDDQF